jgi:hypothetical protein
MRGAADRVIYLIDRAGKIVFRRLYGLDELPSLAKMLEILGDLS